MSGHEDVLDYMNLSDVPDGPPTIPDGEYLLKIVDVDDRETKEGGGHYLNYRVVVQAGPHAGYSFFSMWITKNAAGKKDTVWRTKRDWKVLGYAPVGSPKLSEIVGLEGYAKITSKDRQDGSRENTIKTWLSAA